MVKFYPLRVRDLRHETADCVSLAFDVPEHLRRVFDFREGQYLTLRTTVDGEEIRRSYSICSSPEDGELRVAIKKVKNGKFSTFANEVLAVGEELELMPPLGKFNVPLEPAQQKHYLAFAVGSGITPVISILKTVLHREPLSHFTLIYGNRSFDSIIFREELEALKNRYLGRLSIHHVLSRSERGVSLFGGRITEDKCRAFFQHLVDPAEVDEFFICGPEEMMLAVRDTLRSFGVDRNKIHVELFTTAAAKKNRVTRQAPRANGQPTTSSAVGIIIDGNTHELEIPYDGSNILECGSEAGLDLPYACKGGVCCTCKAKLLEGEVEMSLNYGLEPEEIEAGYILTCQAMPQTDRVVVDYDV